MMNSKSYRLILSMLLVFIIRWALLPITVLAALTLPFNNATTGNLVSTANLKVYADMTYTNTLDILMSDTFFEVPSGVTLTITGSITISSTTENTSFLVQPGGRVVIAEGGRLVLDGNNINNGEVVNYGDLKIGEGKKFYNQATGTLVNCADILSSGSGGTIENMGQFYDYGNIDSSISISGNNPVNEITGVAATLHTTEDRAEVTVTGTLPTTADGVYLKVFDENGNDSVNPAHTTRLTSGDGNSATGTLTLPPASAAGSVVYTIKAGFDGTCWSSQSTTVTMPALPVIAVQGGGTVIPYQGSLVLEVTNAGSFNNPTYQWYRDGTAMPGENGAALTAAGAGSYKAEVTADGRVGESNEIVLTQMPEPLSPNVTADDPLVVTVGADRTFTVYMGQGTAIATGATIVSADPGTAAVAPPSITDDGLITVQGVSPGQTTISISYSGGSRDGQTDTVNVTVNPPPVVPGVTADDPLVITVGAGRTFSVYMGQGTATASSATIVSANPGIAAVAVPSITADETITVNGVSPGQTTISISYIGGSRDGQTDTVNVKVNPLPQVRDNNSGNNPQPPDNDSQSTPATPADSTEAMIKPNFPTTSQLMLAGEPDQNGVLHTSITKEMVQQALDKAKEKAKAEGRSDYGYGLEFCFDTDQTINGLNITFNADALALLETAGIKETGVMTNSFYWRADPAAVGQINRQCEGQPVTVSASRVTNLSQTAGQLIGRRPVWDVTVSFQKDGKTRNIGQFDKGSITMGMRYTPAAGESTGNLAVVYLPSDGKPEILTDSSYHNGWLIWRRNNLSVYGVGYITPTVTFKDTKGHWAKDNIDFAVSRGLLTGTADNTFSPDAAITKGMFLAALGQLSGEEVSALKITGIPDLPADSPLTRENLAVILQNYAKAKGYKIPVSREKITFADSHSISGYAREAVTALQQAGIIAGNGSNQLAPKANVTRAQAATILCRFVECLIAEETARGWSRNDVGQRQCWDRSGKQAVGWQVFEDDSKCYLYYYDKNGMMISGKWLEYHGKHYYFYPDGTLAVDTVIDGFKVGSNGERE